MYHRTGGASGGNRDPAPVSCGPMDLRYRCDDCGMETVNPTRVHICPECGGRVCSECLEGHQRAHEGAPGRH